MATAQTGQLGPVSETFLPSTFMERGVSVPFTSQKMAGARVRMDREGRLESVLPNPGGRGFYVRPWWAVGELCQPTAHDSQLIERVGRLSLILPRTVRGAAQAVAAEGLAGRSAMSAAQAAIELEAQTRVRTHNALLLRLIEECETRGQNRVPLAHDRPANIQQRGLLSVSQLAETLGCRPDGVTSALQDMAEDFSSLGLGEGAADAYVPRMVAKLAQMRVGLRGLAATSDAAQVDLRLVVEVMDVVLASVETAGREALALPQQMASLVRCWLADLDIVRRQMTTAEWLLDGWERIFSLWRLQEVDKQRGLPAREIAGLLPMAPPAEKLAADMVAPLQKVLQDRHRRGAATVEWQTGVTLLDQIERNEALLAHAY